MAPKPPKGPASPASDFQSQETKHPRSNEDNAPPPKRPTSFREMAEKAESHGKDPQKQGTKRSRSEEREDNPPQKRPKVPHETAEESAPERKASGAGSGRGKKKDESIPPPHPWESERQQYIDGLDREGLVRYFQEWPLEVTKVVFHDRRIPIGRGGSKKEGRAALLADWVLEQRESEHGSDARIQHVGAKYVGLRSRKPDSGSAPSAPRKPGDSTKKPSDDVTVVSQVNPRSGGQKSGSGSTGPKNPNDAADNQRLPNKPRKKPENTPGPSTSNSSAFDGRSKPDGGGGGSGSDSSDTDNDNKKDPPGGGPGDGQRDTPSSDRSSDDTSNHNRHSDEETNPEENSSDDDDVPLTESVRNLNKLIGGNWPQRYPNKAVLPIWGKKSDPTSENARDWRNNPARGSFFLDTDLGETPASKLLTWGRLGWQTGMLNRLRSEVESRRMERVVEDHGIYDGGKRMKLPLPRLFLRSLPKVDEEGRFDVEAYDLTVMLFNYELEAAVRRFGGDILRQISQLIIDIRSQLHRDDFGLPKNRDDEFHDPREGPGYRIKRRLKSIRLPKPEFSYPEILYDRNHYKIKHTDPREVFEMDPDPTWPPSLQASVLNQRPANKTTGGNSTSHQEPDNGQAQEQNVEDTEAKKTESVEDTDAKKTESVESEEE